jgi:hypothetical protein
MEQQTRMVGTTCPYCGFRNGNTLRIDTGRLQLLTCDVERGGCDRTYAVRVSVVVMGRELKIEGEQE